MGTSRYPFTTIVAGKIAGRASTAITDQYTFVGLSHQDELTRRIQEMRTKAAKKAKVVETKKKETAA